MLVVKKMSTPDVILWGILWVAIVPCPIPTKQKYPGILKNVQVPSEALWSLEDDNRVGRSLLRMQTGAGRREPGRNFTCLCASGKLYPYRRLNLEAKC